MADNYISLDYFQLGGAILLILINVLLSLWLRLGLEKSLLIASLRMVVQLLLIGYILEWLFSLSNSWLIMAIALIMATIARISAVNRTSDKFMDNLVKNRHQVETLLSLVATRWEATHQEITSALTTGMIPTINSMMVMGLVSLLGMMTGQILAKDELILESLLCRLRNSYAS